MESFYIDQLIKLANLSYAEYMYNVYVLYMYMYNDLNPTNMYHIFCKITLL